MSSQSSSISLFKVRLPPEADLMPKLRDVLYSGQISEGPPGYEFEERFGSLIGQHNVLSFCSGTAALHAAILLAGVMPGDEVVTTAMTAEPTNMAIRHAGGKIVWADVDPLNGNIAPASVAERISKRTKAIVAVHYGGVPVSLGALRQIAEQWNIPIIEDAAHALGASYSGKLLGAHSEYVMFSFQAIKHMTTVDGGALVCREDKDVQRGRLLRWFGIDRRAARTEVDVSIIGYKYHMNNLNATIGIAQLVEIGKIIGRHIENGRYFDRALKNVAGLETCTWDVEAEPSYWFYTVLVERRDDLMRRLTERGIECGLVHKRNDKHQVFAESACALPGLDLFYKRMLHLPCGWWVSDGDRERIVSTIKEGW